MRRRLLALVLCVACLLPLCRPVPVHAVAGVDDAALLAAGGVTLIGSMLVAGGAKFASNDDMQRVARDIWDRYIVPSAELSAEVTRIVTDWQYAARLGKRAVINASARLWSALGVRPFSDNVSSGIYSVAGEPKMMTVERAGYRLSFDGYRIIVFDDHVYVLHRFMDGNKPSAFFVTKDGNRIFYTEEVAYYDSYGYFWIDGESLYFKSYYFQNGVLLASIPYADSTDEIFPYQVTYYGASDVSLSGDLIRPGDKSTTVQLPADLPKYGEDGATVEMPVISLDQTDYIIADGDVISSATSEEDVILDAATGDRVQADTDVSNPDKPIAGAGVLDWLKGILKGLLDTIIALLTAIRDGILSIPDLIVKAIAAIFVPSDTAVADVRAAIAARLPVIADVRGVLDNLVDLLQDPTHASSALDLTTVVDFGKHSSGSWGEAKVNLLDASWFLRYKSLTDDIIVGLAWLVFLWRLYGALPNIIHGLGGGAVNDY